MSQKGFASIIFIMAIVVILVAGGYFIFSKKLEPASQQTTSPTQSSTQVVNPAPENISSSESEILANLESGWQTIQSSISFRPTYHNQTENANNIWRTPNSAQFIGKNNLLVRFEDDNYVHVAIFKFNNGKFILLDVLENQAQFSLSDWQNLVNKYGDSSHPISTYTTSLIRNKQIVSFTELTKVSENIFIRNYWE